VGQDPSDPNAFTAVTTGEPVSTSYVHCSRGCRSSHLGVSSGFQTNRGVMGRSTAYPDGDRARRLSVSPEDLRRGRELHDFSELHPILAVEQIREWCASGELAASFPTLPELFSSMSDAEIREWCESGEHHRGPIPSPELPPNPGLLLRQGRALVAEDPEFMARYPEVYKLLFSPPAPGEQGGDQRALPALVWGVRRPQRSGEQGAGGGSRVGRRTRTPRRPTPRRRDPSIMILAAPPRSDAGSAVGHPGQGRIREAYPAG
jgi:hypothetical protein